MKIIQKDMLQKNRLGGGIVLTQIHEIDYLYWFFGNPRSIYSVTGKFSNLQTSVDDYSSSIMRFKNNITTEMHLDFFLGYEYKRCKIKGTKGIIFGIQYIMKLNFSMQRQRVGK